MRPLIGIPPCLDARGRWKPGRDVHHLDALYTRALAECGADVVVLPDQPDPASLAARLDGLLVPGGGDLLPDRPYPEHVRFDPVPEPQLAFDTQLLAASLERGVPVLGVCYGMQLLALHAGARFHYDLATDVPDAGPHRLPDRDAEHALRIAEGSRLASLLGDAPDPVNSRHHQAVADAGDARASAWAPDGVIEAVELPDARFALGVQWHPESLPDAHRQRLFGGFVAACRRGAG